MLSSAVFITCAVTGSGDSVKKNANVPVTPEQIAASALEAHSAGAAIVHVHVRDPASGAPSRDPALFREVCERIRGGNDEVIINLTGGMGGDLLLGPDEAPLDYGRGTDFVGPRARIAHIVELLPRSEEHTSELQSRSDLVCRLLLEKKKKKNITQRQSQEPAHEQKLSSDRTRRLLYKKDQRSSSTMCHIAIVFVSRDGEYTPVTCVRALH